MPRIYFFIPAIFVVLGMIFSVIEPASSQDFYNGAIISLIVGGLITGEESEKK